MPVIDIYVAEGTFADKHQLAADAAHTVMWVEQVPEIPNSARTPRRSPEPPADCLSNVDGESTYARIDVLTNAGALDPDKQLSVVLELTDLVATAAADPALTGRTWVLLTEAPDGGWGIEGHANSNAELASAGRTQIAQLRHSLSGWTRRRRYGPGSLCHSN